jgi:prevent-host-death family protein
LETALPIPNLVELTRMGGFTTMPRTRPPRLSSADLPNHWPLQNAKARFSELVRRARTVGPQHVTIHGRDEVAVISAEAFHRLGGTETGQALIDALQSSPDRDFDIEPSGEPMPFRDIIL